MNFAEKEPNPNACPVTLKDCIKYASDLIFNLYCLA
jgi:hypothetical protein